jgi:hypothetical protein
MDALLDGSTDTIHNGIKLGLGHVSRLRGGQHIGGDGAHALGRLEDGVDDLEALFLALLLVPAALELGGDLVGPALEAGVDGLEVDARVSAGAAARTRIAEGGGQRRVFRGGHARVRPGLGRGIARGGRGLQGGIAGGEHVVIRVVAVVGLS